MELSSPGVDEQPFWLAVKGAEPARDLIAPKVALLRYDMPPWLADQTQWQRLQPRSPHAPSPFRGVSTQEVLEALGSMFSPTELDWELVGVTFVHVPTGPASPQVEITLDLPPWAVEAQLAVDVQPAQVDAPAPAPQAPEPDPVVAVRTPRKWLPEHDEIMAALRGLSWEGYRSLIADMFRHDGFEVFDGEGPDADVIDMEVVRGARRMLVNCQLRGLNDIGVEPLREMAQVALRSGADGVFIISDGDFASDAWSLAHGHELVLVDRDTLLGLVLEFTLGTGRHKSLTAQVRRLVSRQQPRRPNQWAS